MRRLACSGARCAKEIMAANASVRALYDEPRKWTKERYLPPNTEI